MPEQNNHELTFNQYSVLASQILAQQKQIVDLQTAMSRVMEDHEERLRRNELISVVVVFLVILVAVITFFVVRELVTGLVRNG